MSWDHKLFLRHLTTRRFGREFRYFEELDSTNRWLLLNYQQFTMSGGVVLADHQTQGRGRYDRSWFDAPGSSLLASVVLRHVPLGDRTGLLTLLPAVALGEALRDLFSDKALPRLKWPNDVLLNGKKVAGILGQSLSQGDTGVSAIGIGVNVNTEIDQFPTEFRGRATSILIETGEVTQREILLAELLSRWEQLYDLMLTGASDDLRSRWMALGPELGSRLVHADGDVKTSGSFQGIGEHGELLLVDESGQRHCLLSGETLP